MKITKQPSEKVGYDFKFENYLPAGVTVSSAVVTLVPTGPTLGTKTISGTTVQQEISGGAAGNYVATCVATASNGWIRELEFTLVIADT